MLITATTEFTHKLKTTYYVKAGTGTAQLFLERDKTQSWVAASEVLNADAVHNLETYTNCPAKWVITGDATVSY